MSNLLDILYEHQDLKYREFNKKILGVDIEVIGVRMPVLKIIAKKVAKETPDIILTPSKYFEELTVKGLAIGYLNNYNDVISCLYQFVNSLDNWATVDSMASNLKIFKRIFNYEFVEYCLNHKNEYTVRFGYVLMLNYLVEKDMGFIIDKVSNNIRNEYYIEMAISWLLSKAYLTWPNKIIELLDGRLSKFINNKTISKICDSLVVANSEKEYLRKLRIK